MSWFVPDEEGWLCDYAYVRNSNGTTVLKILPKNAALGKIMVYPTSRLYINEGRPVLFRTDSRNFNKFFGAVGPTNLKLITPQAGWTAVAMNHWGVLDRMFAVTAAYGDSTAFVGVPTSFEVGQEIPLINKHVAVEIGWERFPGIIASHETLHAYA